MKKELLDGIYKMQTKVDIRVLKDILGHEQLNTTQIYTHLTDENIKDAMDNNPLADLKIKPREITFDD